MYEPGMKYWSVHVVSIDDFPFSPSFLGENGEDDM